jgi:hypothetical protein
MGYSERSRYSFDFRRHPGFAKDSHDAVGLWWAQAVVCEAINVPGPEKQIWRNEICTVMVPQIGIFAYETARLSRERNAQVIGTYPQQVRQGVANILAEAGALSGMQFVIVPSESYTHNVNGVVTGKFVNQTWRVWPQNGR